MKRIIHFVIVAVMLVLVATSCSKNIYPGDPYRGASANKFQYKQTRIKAKAYRPYKSLNGQPFKSNMTKMQRGKSNLR